MLPYQSECKPLNSMTAHTLSCSSALARDPSSNPCIICPRRTILPFRQLLAPAMTDLGLACSPYARQIPYHQFGLDALRIDSEQACLLVAPRPLAKGPHSPEPPPRARRPALRRELSPCTTFPPPSTIMCKAALLFRPRRPHLQQQQQAQSCIVPPKTSCNGIRGPALRT